MAAESAAALSVLSRLPELHTLELIDLGPAEISALASGRLFSRLSRLVLYRVEFGDESGAKSLASAPLPNLTALEIVGDQGPKSLDADICTLARSPLFERLKSLHASDGRITEAGIRAVAGSPAARTLQSLDVGGNAFGTDGLMTVAQPGTFPGLTTLRLGVAGIESRRTSPRDVARF